MVGAHSPHSLPPSYSTTAPAAACTSTACLPAAWPAGVLKTPTHPRPHCPASCRQQGLEFVSLQNVGCSVHACAALSELLPPSSALSGLHLFNNMSGDEGAGHVARLLGRLGGMVDFKMASSRVGPAGGISIAKALGAGEGKREAKGSGSGRPRGLGKPACRDGLLGVCVLVRVVVVIALHRRAWWWAMLSVALLH